ncbi:MAG: GlmU family protein [Chitinophagales bacterium]
MTNFILFDDARWESLLPLTFTRPVASLRIGIDTLAEKWEHYLQSEVSYLTEKYLSEKFPARFSDENVYVNGGIIADENLSSAVKKLQKNSVLICNGELIALNCSDKYFSRNSLLEHAKTLGTVEFQGTYKTISRPWHIFKMNDEVLRKDFERITKNRKSAVLSSSVIFLGENVFIEEGAKIEAVTINTTTGPVYIGKNTEVMEGAMIRGPFALCEGSVVKMGAKIYGATTVGEHCKVGGELNNVVMQNFSNKAHDGFLGNSVIGEWCNIGADTNNSNLKNTYAEVKLWDYASQKFILTGLQFCGLIMGDHSKCGINTMFNTGTVVGVSSNIFGDGFPRNFIPSFSWGGASGFTTYKLKDAFKVAEEVMKRRNIPFTDIDKKILTTVYEMSEKYRKGELIFLRK